MKKLKKQLVDDLNDCFKQFEKNLHNGDYVSEKFNKIIEENKKLKEDLVACQEKILELYTEVNKTQNVLNAKAQHINELYEIQADMKGELNVLRK